MSITVQNYIQSKHFQKC